MKILYLVHQFFPEYYVGTERVAKNIAGMMQRVGHDVRVVTYGFSEDGFVNEPGNDTQLKRFSYQGIPVTAVRHRKLPDDLAMRVRDPEMAETAARVIAAEHPDVVHVVHPMRVTEFIAAVRKQGIPYLVTLTDFWLICPKINLVTNRGDLCAGPEGGAACRHNCPGISERLLDTRTAMARAILSGAGAITVPSRFVGRIFANEVGNLGFRLIGHGIPYQTIRRNTRRYERKDTITFCYAGTLNKHKGVHLLIEAFRMVSADNIRLKIFGSGPDPLYVSRLEELTRGDARIAFCGVYGEHELGDIMSSVDVVVLPSLVYETYSLVLHEALASHVPVIASNAGAFAERLKEIAREFLFPVGDSVSLAAVIESIAASPAILNDIKKRTRRAAVPTVEQEAYAYHRIYMTLRRERTEETGS